MMRGFNQEVYKCDKLTMKVLESYPNVQAAAEANGDSRARVYSACKHRRVGISTHVYRFAEDWDRFESMEGKLGRPILRLDLDKKEIAAFASVTEAARITCVSDSSVLNSLKLGSKSGGRYRFKYAR